MFSPYQKINKLKAVIILLSFIVWSKIVFNPTKTQNKTIYEAFLAAMVFGVIWVFLKRYDALKWLYAVGLGLLLLRNTVDFGKYFFYCFSSFMILEHLIQKIK